MFYTTMSIPAADREAARVITAAKAGRSLPDPTTPDGLAMLRSSTSGVPRAEGAVDTLIPGAAGDVRVRVIRPEGEARAVLFDVHGGGWFGGSPEENDHANELIAREAGVVAVSVDYRLAPEHPYPACLEDVLAAVEWLFDHAASEFGTEKLLISGNSVGAHLAALAVLHVRHRHDAMERVVGVSLAYGVFDPSLTLAERLATPTTPVLSTSFLRNTRKLIFPDTAAVLRNPTISPLYADLTGLPPALFTIGELDPLLDDVLFMAERWRAAGNEAEIDFYPGAIHGFMNLVPPLGEHALHRISSWIDDHLLT
ncbi:alpha/beta hydrolase [Pseudonocardia xinjiangensis]|uniref:Alpha/beta hydrolase n=1 Tax=Pseudonocardia xinjiangensis TaxID=75289 RepID=A0ABX1RC13_9PSEU|nr:alpha/beta hydrolase [Pseudonocardia xinjiangensis]NMH77454.1 alpha/beta hydrolase [Pseudonocardia xinjiangensis]